ncbi:hypothetical protein B7P34_06660 [Streptosporangium nondiastaticum]|uniref:Uncharacterized protein n=1 Tax=Streptosporangium nondiastaticum TaxID=35764 RepID=A0A9X7PIU9_9ACTN|nr:hypothetical protein [Streptosporangium nondiastaticum]PSJ29545.1 hypothetical protein B7P34_06660 [Streptosporangium nondiastaticum]
MIGGGQEEAESRLPPPLGMELLRVQPAMIKLHDFVDIDGAWHPVINMVAAPGGRVLIFKNRPPQIVTGLITISRKINYSIL